MPVGGKRSHREALHLTFGGSKLVKRVEETCAGDLQSWWRQRPRGRAGGDCHKGAGAGAGGMDRGWTEGRALARSAIFS